MCPNDKTVNHHWIYINVCNNLDESFFEDSIDYITTLGLVKYNKSKDGSNSKWLEITDNGRVAYAILDLIGH